MFESGVLTNTVSGARIVLPPASLTASRPTRARTSSPRTTDRTRRATFPSMVARVDRPHRLQVRSSLFFSLSVPRLSSLCVSPLPSLSPFVSPPPFLPPPSRPLSVSSVCLSPSPLRPSLYLFTTNTLLSSPNLTNSRSSSPKLQPRPGQLQQRQHGPAVPADACQRAQLRPR